MSNYDLTQNSHLFIPDEAPPSVPRKDVEEMMQEYLKKGGKITKLPCKYKRNSVVEDLKDQKKKRRRRKKKEQ